MSCDCKKVKKIEKLIPNANNKSNDRKGISKYIMLFLNSLRTVFLKLIVAIILMIMCPLVILILVFNLFVVGKTTIRLPKKIVEKMIHNDKK